MIGHARAFLSAILLCGAAGAAAQPVLSDMTPCREIAKPTAVPDDFSLTYRSGPTHTDWGTTTITIVRASGLATITEQRRAKKPGGPREQIVHDRKIAKTAVQHLYATVQACDFFALEASYWNRRVMDGSSSSLQVTAGGKSHMVAVHHYGVKRFSTIVSELNAALKN